MSFNKPFLSLIFGAFATAACTTEGSRESTTEFPGLVAIEAPAESSVTAYCAASAAVEWTPMLASNRHSVRITPAIRPTVSSSYSDSIELDDGTLLASDIGEFAGGVTWKPRGRSDSLVVWEANVMDLIRRGDTVYGIGGLAHMTLDRGTISRFSRDSHGWRADTVLDLGSAPLALQQITADSLVLLTVKGLQVASLRTRTTRMLHRNSAWSFAYPSSVVRDSAGTYYVGLRYAVARLTPQPPHFREEWLVPASCPAFRLSSGRIADQTARCECTQ